MATVPDSDVLSALHVSTFSLPVFWRRVNILFFYFFSYQLNLGSLGNRAQGRSSVQSQGNEWTVSPGHLRQPPRRAQTTSSGLALSSRLCVGPEAQSVCRIKPRSSGAVVVSNMVGAVSQEEAKGSGAGEAERP